MMQQIGSGNVRAVDEDAIAGKMTAYVHTTNNDRFVRLAAQYTDCMTEQQLRGSQKTKLISYLGFVG
tara:strand:+ start:147 stop:347 length:201 start_codon:yes stop_codon:yes gene_type:complete